MSKCVLILLISTIGFAALSAQELQLQALNEHIETSMRYTSFQKAVGSSLTYTGLLGFFLIQTSTSEEDYYAEDYDKNARVSLLLTTAAIGFGLQIIPHQYRKSYLNYYEAMEEGNWTEAEQIEMGEILLSDMARLGRINRILSSSILGAIALGAPAFVLHHEADTLDYESKKWIFTASSLGLGLAFSNFLIRSLPEREWDKYLQEYPQTPSVVEAQIYFSPGIQSLSMGFCLSY